MERFPFFSFLEKNSRALALLFPLTHKNLKMENVHKLRVATRRLRSLLWLLEEEGLEVGPAKSLKKLGRALGEKRELDVMEEDAKIFGIKLKGLKKRKQASLEGVKRSTHPRVEKELLEKLKALREISKELSNAPIAKKKLREKLRGWEKRKLTEKNFHTFRVLMKKVRYALEALGKKARPLKPLQEHLGRAHDLQVLGNESQKNKQLKGAQKASLAAAKKLKEKAIASALKELTP
jgi:CHAD domain-containing protein